MKLWIVSATHKYHKWCTWVSHGYGTLHPLSPFVLLVFSLPWFHQAIVLPPSHARMQLLYAMPFFFALYLPKQFTDMDEFAHHTCTLISLFSPSFYPPNKVPGCYLVMFTCSPTSIDEISPPKTCVALANLQWSFRINRIEKTDFPLPIYDYEKCTYVDS